jgi:hypothetical protein
MELLPNHIEKIKNLNPFEDSVFKYQTSKWLWLNEEYKSLIKSFENEKITRAQIITAFEDYYLNSCNHIMPFLLTMVWGFAKSGYGNFRTNNYLSRQENLERIKSAIDKVKDNKIEQAFNSLNEIDGLGVSFISKVLYFASRAAKIEQYALIFDIRVANSLVQLTTPKEVFEIVNVSPSNKYKDYKKYNDYIHSLASKYNLDAESIEMFLFEQNF